MPFVPMNSISRGLIAGFVATVALSLLMVMKSMMGLMPQLDMIAMLTNAANSWMGLPAAPAVGWIIHFMVGTVVYGVPFALFNHLLPGHSQTVKGMVIGIIGWAIMMIMLMPMMGQGLFGMNIGIVAPIMTLVLHIIFGAVLGWTYVKLSAQNRHSEHARV